MRDVRTTQEPIADSRSPRGPGWMWVLSALAGLVVAAAGFVIQKSVGPYSGTWHFDPSYAYLLNALNITQGLTPRHIDHPGTTLQELGSAVLYLGWRSGYVDRSAVPLVTSVLHHPETYLALINDVLLALLGVAVAFVTKRMSGLVGPPLLALVVVALLLTSPATLECLSQVQPEPLFFGLVMVAATLAVPTHAPSTPMRFQRAVCLGVVLGASIVTKITCLPLLALIIALPDLLTIVAAFVSVVLSIVVLTYPIWPVLSDMFTWQRNLLTHQGQYGAGAPGLPPVDQMLASAQGLMRDEIILPICLATMAVALCLRLLRRSEDPLQRSWMRFYVAGALTVAAQIIIVAKHPGNHYLLPAVAASTVLIPAALHEAFVTPISKAITTVAILVVVVMLGPRAFLWEKKRIEAARANERANAELVADAAKLDCKIVRYYPAPGIPSSFHLGEDYAGARYASELQEMYPDFVYYDVYQARFESYLSVVAPSQVEARSGPTCLLGGVLESGNEATRATLVLLKTAAELKLYQIVKAQTNPTSP